MKSLTSAVRLHPEGEFLDGQKILGMGESDDG